MLRKIHLHGDLARQFDPIYQLDVSSAGEAGQALAAVVPGFRQYATDRNFRVLRGDPDTGMALGPDDLDFQLGYADLHIVPVIAGAGNRGLGKIIAGVFLIGAAFMFPGAITGIGIGGSTIGGAMKVSVTDVAPDVGDPVVREVQEMLKKRGFDPGTIDGWFGQKTKAAVLTYQMAHPHLKNDGIIGPATISQLRRDMAALKDAATKSGASALASGALAWSSGLPVGWIVAGVAVLAVGWFAWRYRDVVARRVNSLTGHEVEV